MPKSNRATNSLAAGIAALARAGARYFRPVFRAPLSRELENAGARLLGCLTDERRTRALARQTVREMLYLVLEGPYGDSLRALAEGSAGQLAHVLRHMSTRYAERLSVGTLAKASRSSAASTAGFLGFHRPGRLAHTPPGLRDESVWRVESARSVYE